MKTSVTVYSLRDYFARGLLDVPKFIELVAEMGAEGVDLGYYWRSRKERKEAKKKLSESGLELAIYITSSDFSKPKVEERKAEIEKAKKSILEAKEMEAAMLRVHPGDLKPGVNPVEAEQWVSESLAEVADFAAGEGIVIAVENHGRYFSGADVMERLFKADKRLRLVFDTGNFTLEGDDPVTAAEKLAKWVVHVHAKDRDEKGRMCSPGEGIIDFEKICRILSDEGFSGFYSVEYEGWRDQLLGVGLGIGYLKALHLKRGILK
ncbi:MAG: sugar phosphate isomerase/epimerase family protein [Thermofilaceae archaeon]